ncbi:hypothetical protein EGW08_010664 [Elysia chlorotica]|uniref:Uncharacterized protein n=1 Tax=Elysia chlorotica TaxID=188477 RepID=A0A3S1BII1_ELYCH|nr:hypothetical protein EGW08_010664 [Elysia chlorotica]
MRKSVLGDALLGVSSFISDTVSMSGDKSPTQARGERRRDEQSRSRCDQDDAKSDTTRTKSVRKSPSVQRKLRDSTESFSREMGIDPLPPVTSSNRNQAPLRDSTGETEKSLTTASKNQNDPVEKPPLTIQHDKSNGNIPVKESSKTSDADTKQRIDTSTSSRPCDEGKRVILPRLTSVESTTKPAPQRDGEAASPSSKGKPNGRVVKVEEVSSMDDAKVKADSNVANKGETTKAKALAKSETLPAQISEEEMKRRRVVESMVRVSRETRKKRITQ